MILYVIMAMVFTSGRAYEFKHPDTMYQTQANDEENENQSYSKRPSTRRLLAVGDVEEGTPDETSRLLSSKLAHGKCEKRFHIFVWMALFMTAILSSVFLIGRAFGKSNNNTSKTPGHYCDQNDDVQEKLQCIFGYNHYLVTIIYIISWYLFGLMMGLPDKFQEVEAPPVLAAPFMLLGNLPLAAGYASSKCCKPKKDDA